MPAEAFWDLDLYRWWMYLALEDGTWPVLDGPWVYPAGAILPMLLPGLGSTVSTPGFALGWSVMVTILNGAAMAMLLRLPRGSIAGWWWAGTLLLLGPVALGRLDAVVAPVTLVALAAQRTAPATVLLTAGAWVKVMPGALLLPLAAAARRPWRDVVLPAALVSGMVVVAVAAGGGLAHLGSFLGTQSGRGLQVEAVGATPWVLAALVRPDVAVVLDVDLNTYEVVGPGVTVAGRVLDGLLVALVAAVGLLLVRARRTGRAGTSLLPAALVLVTVLVVANKVGSPQYLTWFLAPAAALLAVGPPVRWVRATAGLLAGAAGLTQVVFPWGYPALISGDPWLAGVLAVRNVLLVAVLVLAGRGLWLAAGGGTAGGRTAGEGTAGEGTDGGSATEPSTAR